MFDFGEFMLFRYLITIMNLIDYAFDVLLCFNKLNKNAHTSIYCFSIQVFVAIILISLDT